MMTRTILLFSLLFLAATTAVSAAGAPAQILAGTSYATDFYVITAPESGPSVMVTGGVHGNEPAGARAAEAVLRLPLLRGTLVVIPQVNLTALRAGERTLPQTGDVNRAFPGSADGTPAEQLAFAIAELMREYGVTMLIDLHESRDFHLSDRESVGQTIIFGRDDRSTMLALGAAGHINAGIAEKHKKFTFLSNPVRGSTADFASRQLGIAGFTLETSKKQPLADRVAQHVELVRFLLRSEGMTE